MDLDGVYATLCFPSLIAGFAGTIFAKSKDAELGLACLRAWNDWHIDEWAGPHPDRIIPLQLAWLPDPEIAAADMRRNAERGFKAVSFPENPVDLGLPSMHTEHWDPFLRACEETQTVVCLHNGRRRGPRRVSPARRSSSTRHCSPSTRWSPPPTGCGRASPPASPRSESRSPRAASAGCRCSSTASTTCSNTRRSAPTDWDDPNLAPTDALRRNFWFCTIDIPSTMACASTSASTTSLGERLPARRLHLARTQPGRSPGSATSHPRSTQGHVAERVEAVPPPGAGRTATTSHRGELRCSI